ncbi:MAG: Asp23/Gls24 family envelope stress response protein [Bacilli bacterium]|jgi:uncharacterized alkaline shock family protein YloU|nr:Asp23/Gls24 family envelope stress response protein [Bacilli bacterium]MCH4210485.1 Asp23/Gls24 family envelope stress response protein [Bacilli bacterium]MCH4228291.1 Asp23/Gls24 family envelope stress response protein [Bacilli bacterium]MCH4277360.1 Asp23/Gls24 family envelope stress response protein [Bacilli bacterium]MCI2054712.1 Asp23/Gls24 family envelope stress response protein [Bacilli bacterium]
MKRDYYYLHNYQSKGAIGISRHAFETIATIAANQVKGASVSTKKGRLFNLEHPVKASFRKDGKVDFNLDVNIKSGANVKDVCLQIQEGVASAITMMCETVPFGIEIKVVSVK